MSSYIARRLLLMIPTFSFDWQLGYECAPGSVRLPKGTTLSAVAHYDNSEENPANPDPSGWPDPIRRRSRG